MFRVLIGRAVSIFSISDLLPETGAAGSGPADRLVSADKLFHKPKKKKKKGLFFFSSLFFLSVSFLLFLYLLM